VKLSNNGHANFSASEFEQGLQFRLVHIEICHVSPEKLNELQKWVRGFTGNVGEKFLEHFTTITVVFDSAHLDFSAQARNWLRHRNTAPPKKNWTSGYLINRASEKNTGWEKIVNCTRSRFFKV